MLETLFVIWLVATILVAIVSLFVWGICKLELREGTYFFTRDPEKLMANSARMFFLCWAWPVFAVLPLWWIWKDFSGTLNLNLDWTRKKDENA